MTEQETGQSQAISRQSWPIDVCATAATKSALTALITGEFIDPVGIILPEGDVPFFPLVLESLGEGYAMAAIAKEAGEEPDAADGATIIATVFPAPPATGIIFQAGDGVGTISATDLTLPQGEAAITPETRKMMSDICEEICARYELPADLVILISVPDGEEIAAKSPERHHGISGGVSI